MLLKWKYYILWEVSAYYVVFKYGRLSIKTLFSNGESPLKPQQGRKILWKHLRGCQYPFFPLDSALHAIDFYYNRCLCYIPTKNGIDTATIFGFMNCRLWEFL